MTISGNNRTAAVNTTLSTPFVVEVRDQDGDALSGITVAFAVTAGGGTLSASSVTTDASGRAQSTLTLGSTVGTNTVTASVSGITGSITFTATATAEVFPLTVSVTVPATAELGETVDISATVTGEDSIEWKTTGGSIDDPSAVDTELTVPSESGVIAVTCVATDVDGATESDTAYVTVGDPAAHIYTPAVRIEIEGVDVTDRRIPRDGMTVGKSIAPREQLIFLSNGLQFNLDNADGMFDYSDPNNFFVANSRPAHGRGAQVLVEVGLSSSELIPVFAGQISEVQTSLVNTKARIKVRDISVNLRQNVIKNFGEEITRRITDFDGVNDDYDDLDPIFYFPAWGLPIARQLREPHGRRRYGYHGGGHHCDIGHVEQCRAEVDYNRGLIRFEAPPTDGADTEITATWKVDYQYKRPDFLIRQLLAHSGIQSELGITDEKAARFGIEQALVAHPTDESFSSHGRPYSEENGVMRWIKRDGYMVGIQDARLIKYDAGAGRIRKCDNITNGEWGMGLLIRTIMDCICQSESFESVRPALIDSGIPSVAMADNDIRLAVGAEICIMC